MSLSNVEKLALSKFRASKSDRSEVAAGTYEVDFTVNVKGHLKVGEDFEKNSTCSLLSLDTLALVLHYAGVTRESAIKAITKAFTETAENKASGITAKSELSESIKKIHDKLKKEIAENLPKTSVKGTVTSKCVALASDAQ